MVADLISSALLLTSLLSLRVTAAPPAPPAPIVVRLHGLPVAAWKKHMHHSCPSIAGRFEIVDRDRPDISAVMFYAPELYQTLGRNIEPRLPHQHWMLISQESPINLVQYNAVLERYRYSFTATATYQENTAVVWNYGTCRPDSRDSEAPYKNYAAGKKHLATWSVSNCHSFSQREMLASGLLAELGAGRLHIYGGCGWSSLRCPRTDPSCTARLISDYKFTLAFENSLCVDYITEKTWTALIGRQDIVPVVMALADLGARLPPHSYIDVRDYASTAHLARYLRYLDSNDTAYNEYFAWRRQYRCSGMVGECHIGEWLLKTVRDRVLPKPIDLEKKFSIKSDCMAYRYYLQTKNNSRNKAAAVRGSANTARTSGSVPQLGGMPSVQRTLIRIVGEPFVGDGTSIVVYVIVMMLTLVFLYAVVLRVYKARLKH